MSFGGGRSASIKTGPLVFTENYTDNLAGCDYISIYISATNLYEIRPALTDMRAKKRNIRGS
jgi:hypothetical protein